MFGLEIAAGSDEPGDDKPCPRDSAHQPDR